MSALRGALLFGVVAATLTSPRPAQAFKGLSHVASANRALDQLNQIDFNQPGPATLEFEVKGRKFTVNVNAKEAYLAITRHPDFFRAGVIGPDGFPDLVSGQYWLHSNTNTQAGDLTKWATGDQVKPTERGVMEPAEARVGTSEFRSIDFAMGLLEFMHHGEYSFADDTEREQVLAFVMGFFSHGAGDSFAHTWANEYAGGAWELSKGKGVFGPVTQEIKHIAVETLLDARVPGSLQNQDGTVGGALDRMSIQAPVRFLDAFFSREIKGAQKFGDKDSSDYEEFLNYYKHFDRFYGAAVYNYFNIQVEAAQAIKRWSGMSSFMNFAEKWQPGPFLNTLLDIVDFPGQVQAEIESWIGGDLVPFLTGGYIKCELFNGGTTGLEALRKVWDYLGGFNDRIRLYEEKAKVVRRNWIRLSECTSQNMVRMTGGDYHPEQPDLNRDACAVLADRRWQDEGDPLGLDRGTIRSEDDEESREFLEDLRNYFRGLDDDGDGFLERAKPFEVENKHRSLGSNLKRMKSYLFGFAFIIDSLHSVVFPDKHATNFDHACGLVRDPAEKRCLNLQLLPLALPFKQATCLYNEGICIGKKVASCLSGLCRTACGGLSVRFCVPGTDMCASIDPPCDAICDGTKAACDGVVDSVCSAVSWACIPLVGCADEVCRGVFKPACNWLAGGDERCASDLFNCAAEGIDCSLEGLEMLFLNEGYADELLAPMAEFCDAFDWIRNFYRRFDTVEERMEFVDAMGIPITRYREFETQVDRVMTEMPKYPAEYFVNMVFLYDDLREYPNSDYAKWILQRLAEYDAQNAALPAGQLKDERTEAAKHIRDIVGAAQSSNPSIPLLADLSVDPNLAALGRDLNEFKVLADHALEETDPAARNARLQEFANKLAKYEADTAAMAAGEVKQTREAAAQRLHLWLDQAYDAAQNGYPPPPLLRADLDPFFTVASRELRVFEHLLESVVIPTFAGPTATRVLSDVGPDMQTTFKPFFNAVQGIKLAPMRSRLDVEALFTREGVPVDRLPWKLGPKDGKYGYSHHCRDNSLFSLLGPMSLYCDVFISFDDPNCLGGEGQGCQEKDPRADWFDWVPTRTLVVWNPYDPTGKTPKNVLTRFPLASRQEAYEKIFTRIFHVPDQVPAFMGFEDPTKPWTSDGPGTVTQKKGDATQGNSALAVTGCGYTPIRSPLFETTEFEVVGAKLALDVKLPVAQSNPSWLGQVQVFVTIPGANIYNAPLGAVELTPLAPLGTWKTLEFDVPEQVRAAMLGVYANAQFTVVLNVGSCQGDTLIDNLRFTGDLARRTVFKEVIQPASPSSLFGFEKLSDWNSNVPVAAETGKTTQGSASLAFVKASGWSEINSRSFGNADVGTVGSELRMDVFVPDPQPNPYWVGDIQASLTCQSLGINSKWLGMTALNFLAREQWNTVRMPLAEDVATALRTRTYGDCTLKVSLNVASNAGTFLFDNLAWHD